MDSFFYYRKWGYLGMFYLKKYVQLYTEFTRKSHSSFLFQKLIESKLRTQLVSYKSKKQANNIQIVIKNKFTMSYGAKRKCSQQILKDFSIVRFSPNDIYNIYLVNAAVNCYISSTKGLLVFS